MSIAGQKSSGKYGRRRVGGRRRRPRRVAAGEGERARDQRGARTGETMHDQRASFTAVRAGGAASTLRDTAWSSLPRKERNAA